MTSLAERALDAAVRHATYLIFAAVLLWFGLQSPVFLMPESLANIVKQSSFIGIAAIGMTFVLLTGGIDLSVGSVMFLAALIAGMVMRALDLPVPAGMVVALLTGVVLGLINAFFIVVLRVIPFIVTLATLFLFRGFGIWLTSSTQFDFPPAMRAFGLSSILGVPLPIVVFAAFALMAHVVLAHTTFGRQVYAFGNDPEAARKSGVKIAWVQARVYVISSACAAVAGFVLIAQIGRLDAGFGEGREFDVIAAAVLGGASLMGGSGTALGAVMGATLIQTVKMGLVFTGVNLYLQPILQGAIIFLAVLADGLRNTRMRSRLRRTIRTVEPASGPAGRRI
ncbi:ABC transporter permease [Paracoccus tibetensis]|uniref:Autoinducer 2 import system permease protein LsrD n=1 Tax=Paracoccus tibetensis TaxID=336292 RepID=A0A1G5HN50_9RHOB|nr:ABC transporter permease [Paracoccus tibetensis]SCY65295.1 ribose transport system permease protein [Paracoccus tibetensis]